jgi:hypothetical protein
MSGASPFPQSKRDVFFHVDGITVNKTNQPVESAAASRRLKI